MWCCHCSFVTQPPSTWQLCVWAGTYIWGSICWVIMVHQVAGRALNNAHLPVLVAFSGRQLMLASCDSSCVRDSWVIAICCWDQIDVTACGVWL
jgi:hypothetical protein